MDKLQTIVRTVLEQQRLQLAPSTYEVRRRYLEQLPVFAKEKSISKPCQELYDSYVSRATTPDLRFQLFHAVRLVDKEAGTKAFTPEGKLYNEPAIPSIDESEKVFREISFPIPDDSIDTGHLILRHAEGDRMEFFQKLPGHALFEDRFMLFIAAHVEIPVPKRDETLSEDIRIHKAVLAEDIQLPVGHRRSRKKQAVAGLVSQLVHSLGLRRSALFQLVPLVGDDHIRVILL